MNSSSLQEQYNDVYQDFFSQNNVVVAIPHILHWWHIMGRKWSPIKIKQKVPTKMYCGVSLTEGDDISIGECICFNQLSQSFVKTDAKTILWDESKIIAIVKKYCTEVWMTSWIKIAFLSECERGHGFWFIAIVFTLLSTIINILGKRIDYKLFDDYQKFLSSDEFTLVFEMSKEMRKDFWWTSQGATSYAALSWTHLPTVQLGNEDPIAYTTIEQLTWVAYKGDISIDYGLMYFWVPYDSEYIAWTYSYNKEKYEDIMAYAENIKGVKNLSTPIFSENWYDSIEYFNNYLHVKLIKAWQWVLQNMYDQNAVKSFIDVITEAWLFSVMTEQEKETMVDMYYLFKKVRSFSDEIIWLLPISTSKLWGCFLFVTQYQKSRQTIARLLDKLRENNYQTTILEYASWLDGKSWDGVEVMQYIEKWRFSKFLDEQSVMFETLQWSFYIATHPQILEKEKGLIIFDTIKRKVLVSDALATHKDLRSQSGTVEIMDILFANKWEYVHNSKFPLSSYSKNKNEMLWKIILPIKELVKKTLKKELHLTCTWSIHDFHIMLEESSVEIGIIKRAY